QPCLAAGDRGGAERRLLLRRVPHPAPEPRLRAPYPPRRPLPGLPAPPVPARPRALPGPAGPRARRAARTLWGPVRAAAALRPAQRRAGHAHLSPALYRLGGGTESSGRRALPAASPDRAPARRIRGAVPRAGRLPRRHGRALHGALGRCLRLPDLCPPVAAAAQPAQ